MARGGARAGAGAPIGNTNAYQHGRYSGKSNSRVKQHLLSLSDDEAQLLSESCQRYCQDWLVRFDTPIQSKTMRTWITGKRGGQYGNTNALKTGFHMGQIKAHQRTKEFFEALSVWGYLIERDRNKINEAGLSHLWSS